MQTQCVKRGIGHLFTTANNSNGQLFAVARYGMEQAIAIGAQAQTKGVDVLSAITVHRRAGAGYLADDEL
ncbi:MAG: hypothetical protein OEM60_13300 [Gammaproteobacteria bacterium]|nr:hypothetical protein [Gammaproteobacteria bacterium]